MTGEKETSVKRTADNSLQHRHPQEVYQGSARRNQKPKNT